MIRKSFGGVSRFFIMAVLLLAISMSCAWAQLTGVTETKLDNGLTVLTKEVHAAPVFTAQVWFKVGSRDEHTGITGVSHLLEHMLFNSSKNFRKGEISNMIRKRGGIENAATWTDFTYYWQLLSSDNLEFALQTLAERVGNASLREDEFKNERTVVLSELEGRENDPDWILYRDDMAAAFMAHPYQWPVIGWRSDVENIDIQQLRNYYNAYYYPNNATLVLVGDFNSKNAIALVKKYFGDKPKHNLPEPMHTAEPPQRGERDVTVRMEGNAERVMLAYHIPNLTNPDTYPIMVLDQVMSGGRSSRLYQALVETRLATSAWSNASTRKDPSLFFFGATAQRGVNADALRKELLNQIEKAKSAPPTDQEMQAAKNQLQASFVFQNDSVSDQGEQLGYYATVADWTYLDKLIPNINAVTPEQVQDVAKKYFTTDNLTAATFIPTDGTATGGAPEAAPAAGPVEHSTLPTKAQGLSFYDDGESADQSDTDLQEAEDAQTADVKEEDTQPSDEQSADIQLTSQPATTPAAGPAKTSGNNLVRPQRVVLDNGIVVIVQENHSNPTVAISGVTKAGGYFDPQGKDGVAELTAEMIGRGTKTRSALDLARASEFVGASLSTSAEVERMSFGAKSLTKDFPLMLDLLSDELRNATFPQDQFDRAKGERASGLEQSKESPEAVAFRAFYNSIYPDGHPYHEPTIEQAQQELQSITRDDLVSFYNSYYRPDTTIITIVGDVNAAAAVDAVKKYFGDWKAEGAAPKVDIATVQPTAQPAKIVMPMMDKSEVDIVYGYPLGLKRSDPDYYAFRVLNQILGGAGALTSILGDEIREKKGLVYNVYSSFSATLGAGPWYAALGTNPNNADKAIDVLKTEVADFKQRGATREEFEQARDFIVGVFPIALETNEGVASALLNAEFYGLGMDYLRNYANIYRAVTLDQVNAAAQKYLHPESATLVVAGPYQETK